MMVGCALCKVLAAWSPVVSVYCVLYRNASGCKQVLDCFIPGQQVQGSFGSCALLLQSQQARIFPVYGVFGHFDLAALCGCHTINVCYVMLCFGLCVGLCTQGLGGCHWFHS